MRYQSVLQHSEEDCGAACLATIAKHYRRTAPLPLVEYREPKPCSTTVFTVTEP
ncbi:cysteine peptidase family C39 domain-containing protein [Nostoc sp.]|uniref:cysteine peptidase family C39 domain-containing protein n=1 Tax=Nostoc sp. TaxID=1180 RepID=UPI002FF8F950